VVPRLLAANSDLNRIEIVSMVVASGNRDRMFNLGTDLGLLRKKIAEVGDVKLVLIDPISAYLGTGKIDSFRTTDVRAVLGPLVDLANELGVAFVGIMHFNKRTDVTVSPFFGRPRGDFWEWGCILRASCSGSCTVLRPVGPEVPGRPPSPGGKNRRRSLDRYVRANL
jgi:hypothetical protein